MPILTVEIVHDPGAVLASDLARKLADEAGRVLRSKSGTVWVTVNPVPGTRYAESGGGDQYRPIFVRVLARELPEAPARADEVAALTLAVARVAAGIPDRST